MALAFPLPPAGAAERDPRCFELRVYYAAAGKLDDLHARFRNHVLQLFEKHHMTSIGYWTPIENPDNKLIYLLAYPSREAREKLWAEFRADPEWKAVQAASEKNGELVTRVEASFLQATDFSPAIKPFTGKSRRVFELRTYTAATSVLPILLKRFRDHTMELFIKHGMTNFGYWTLTPEESGADRTLIYLLVHDSRAAADASFKAFRADPEWVAVKEASEKEAGGSLTVVPDGVKSVFLEPTDYSPAW